ncbi:MAG: hypothetical protein IJO90_05490 [Alistipes sp.]|nr:hypothetical protein [Alistipes sp.]
MKRLPIFITAVALACGVAGAQTYYYERVAVVENNVKRSASGDGHFITFTANACYDSDIEGFSEDFGVLKYQGVTSRNLRNYQGQSYFGEANYYFAADLSRLNIYKSDGQILVYARKTPPSGVRKSSRQKITKSAPMPIVIPSSGDVNIDVYDSSDDSHKKHKEQSRYGYYTCPTCHGTKQCQTCGGDGIWRNSYEGLKDYMCPNCPNSSGRCPSCNGTGKKYGIIR